MAHTLTNSLVRIDNELPDSNSAQHSALDEKNLIELKKLISKLLFKDKPASESVASTLGLTLNSIGLINNENEGVPPTFLLSYGRTLVRSGELAIVKKVPRSLATLLTHT